MLNSRLDVGFGVLGSVVGILYWVILITISPGSDVIIANFFWGVVPALLSILSIYFKKSILMLLASLITAPIGLYLSGANNYFVIFGSMPVLYLISFIFMLLGKRHSIQGEKS